MGIYQFCNNCAVKSGSCVARENPYDEDCIDHERFMEMERRKMNSLYYHERYIDDFSRRR